MKTSKRNFGMSSFFTLFIALGLLSTSSFASELKKMQPKPIETVISTNFDFFTLSLSDTHTEENLVIEDWMLNPDAFLAESHKENDVNQEESLEIENWMLDVQAFLPEEKEPELALEKWMLDVNSFIDNSDHFQNFAKR